MSPDVSGDPAPAKENQPGHKAQHTYMAVRINIELKCT